MPDPVMLSMLTVIPVLVVIGFAVVLGMVVLRLVRAGRTTARNAALPEQTVAARVTGKRTQVEGGGETPVRNIYFATFELPDGQRLELKVPPREYSQVAEGDEGRLTLQGTWYRGFERSRVIPTDGTWEAPGGPSLPPPRDG